MLARRRGLFSAAAAAAAAPTSEREKRCTLAPEAKGEYNLVYNIGSLGRGGRWKGSSWNVPASRANTTHTQLSLIYIYIVAARELRHTFCACLFLLLLLPPPSHPFPLYSPLAGCSPHTLKFVCVCVCALLTHKRLAQLLSLSLLLRTSVIGLCWSRPRLPASKVIYIMLGFVARPLTLYTVCDSHTHTTYILY